MLIETAVESVESAILVDKTVEGLHGDADASRYNISSWRAEFVNLMMMMMVVGMIRDKVEGEWTHGALYVFLYFQQFSTPILLLELP